MPIPLLCATCDHVVGVDSSSSLSGLRHVTRTIRSVHCPGRGKHLKPVVTKASPLSGTAERTIRYYPETKTEEIIDT